MRCLVIVQRSLSYLKHRKTVRPPIWCCNIEYISIFLWSIECSHTAGYRYRLYRHVVSFSIFLHGCFMFSQCCSCLFFLYHPYTSNILQIPGEEMFGSPIQASGDVWMSRVWWSMVVGQVGWRYDALTTGATIDCHRTKVASRCLGYWSWELENLKWMGKMR